jgi:hypothetical protein
VGAVTEFDRDHGVGDAQRAVVPVDTNGQGHDTRDTQGRSALATVPDQTSPVSMPQGNPSGPATIQQDHTRADAHSRLVLLDPVDQGQAVCDVHIHPALVAPSQAILEAASNADSPGLEDQPDDASSVSDSNNRTPRPADRLLLIFADAFDDLERVRIATENRVRSLGQVKGLDGTDMEARLLELVDALQVLEHQAELSLKRALRTHPLGPWVKATVGIGEKQGARLLAAIGDPAWNHAEDRPRRGPAELWAYCGLHVINPGQSSADAQPFLAGDPSGQDSADAQVGSAAGSGHPGDHEKDVSQASVVSGVAPKRARGQKANWNATAKMRAFLIAESCIKQAASPYRAVYDEGRAHYADAVHPQPCAQCGPKGKPAQPGSPLSAGHQHARALRLVMKAILRDLWVEARRVS